MASTSAEIIAFLLTISGWVLVSSTLPTDYWKVSTIDGTVITTATFWANLWKTCVTDSTGVSNCKDFPSMLALDGQAPADPHPNSTPPQPPPPTWWCAGPGGLRGSPPERTSLGVILF
uniref:Claudin n=1 Tax=Strix occidentalis caurina TaxID=311401 RepID=A0A8D0EJ57_STROC